ncbi:MAG TPA: YbaB/EbfC family nucleoid-associated protein [Aldersonia sp.]
MNPMDTLVGDATARLADLERAMHDLAEVRGRHTTPDGLITALVDGHGALIELHLAEAITTLPAREIGPAVAAACAEAAARAAERRAEVVAQLSAAFTHHATP